MSVEDVNLIDELTKTKYPMSPPPFMIVIEYILECFMTTHLKRDEKKKNNAKSKDVILFIYYFSLSSLPLLGGGQLAVEKPDMIGNGRWWAAWVIKSLIKREKELLLRLLVLVL